MGEVYTVRLEQTGEVPEPGVYVHFNGAGMRVADLAAFRRIVQEAFTREHPERGAVPRNVARQILLSPTRSEAAPPDQQLVYTFSADDVERDSGCQVRTYLQLAAANAAGEPGIPLVRLRPLGHEAPRVLFPLAAVNGAGLYAVARISLDCPNEPDTDLARMLLRERRDLIGTLQGHVAARGMPAELDTVLTHFNEVDPVQRISADVCLFCALWRHSRSARQAMQEFAVLRRSYPVLTEFSVFPSEWAQAILRMYGEAVTHG